MSKRTPKPPRNLKFEQAMERLDRIVEAMESGEVGIEESIARYEEAMQLAAHCRKILDEAEQRVRRIQLDAEGRLDTSAFEAPPAAEDEEPDDAS